MEEAVELLVCSGASRREKRFGYCLRLRLRWQSSNQITHRRTLTLQLCFLLCSLNSTPYLSHFHKILVFCGKQVFMLSVTVDLHFCRISTIFFYSYISISIIKLYKFSVNNASLLFSSPRNSSNWTK